MPLATAMDISDVLAGISTLHSEASQLMREALHTKPTLGMALQPAPLRELEDRLDKHVSAFLLLDEEFIRHTTPPSDINSAMRSAAHFQLHSVRRDSVRGLLTDTSGALGSMRNQLDFRRSMLVAVFALVVSIVAVVK